MSAPAAVTVTPKSQVYTTCKTDQYFDFSSSTPGTYSITVSVADTNTVGLYSTERSDVHADGDQAASGQHRPRR